MNLFIQDCSDMSELSHRPTCRPVKSGDMSQSDFRPSDTSAMTIDQRLSDDQCLRITRALAPFNPAVIYIFGSFGGPAQHPGSDIDIAFLPSVPASPLDCFHLSNDLANQLGHAIDLVDLKQASTVMAKEVLHTGTPLFIGNPAMQQEFEMRVLVDYARLNEERQAILSP